MTFDKTDAATAQLWITWYCTCVMPCVQELETADIWNQIPWLADCRPAHTMCSNFIWRRMNVVFTPANALTWLACTNPDATAWLLHSIHPMALQPKSGLDLLYWSSI